jgi:hypothetical protein
MVKSNTQKTENTEDTSADTTTPEEKKELAVFSLGPVTAENMKETAVAVWERIQGEKYSDRADLANEFIKAFRDARDSGKSTRTKTPVEEIFKNAMGKSLADLQTVKVEIGGVSLPIPQVVRLADEKSKQFPLHKNAVDMLKTHGVKAVAEKQGSRGKATTFLRPLDYEPPAPEQKQAA